MGSQSPTYDEHVRARELIREVMRVSREVEVPPSEFASPYKAI